MFERYKKKTQVTCRNVHAVAAGVGEVVLFLGRRPNTELGGTGAPGDPYLEYN